MGAGKILRFNPFVIMTLLSKAGFLIDNPGEL
jgi:hypothetical protein